MISALQDRSTVEKLCEEAHVITACALLIQWLDRRLYSLQHCQSNTKATVENKCSQARLLFNNAYFSLRIVGIPSHNQIMWGDSDRWLTKSMSAPFPQSLPTCCGLLLPSNSESQSLRNRYILQSWVECTCHRKTHGLLVKENDWLSIELEFYSLPKKIMFICYTTWQLVIV